MPLLARRKRFRDQHIAHVLHNETKYNGTALALRSMGLFVASEAKTAPDSSNKRIDGQLRIVSRMMASTAGSKWPLSGCGYLEGGLLLRGIEVVRFSSAFRELLSPAWWQRKIKCRLLRLLVEEVYVAI